MGLVLDPKEQELLENLKELLDFGYKTICKISYPQEEAKLKEAILLTATAACINYSKAILLLAEKGLIIPASALFRSIVELSFFVRYIIKDASNERATIFLTSDLFSRKRAVEKFIELISEAKAPVLSERMGINDLEELKADIEKTISKFGEDFSNKYGHKMKEWPDLAAIALKIDEVETYRTVYWFLSPCVHLNYRGLNGFVVENNERIQLIPNGKTDFFQGLIISTYAHNVGFLGNCHELFDIPTEEELVKFNETLNSIDKAKEFHK